MTSHVLVRRTADCPVSIAPDYAERLFRRFEREMLEVRVRGPIRIAERVRLRFGLHFDDPEGGRGRDAIHFHWWARHWWLPDLCGVVRFGIAPHGRTRIVLEGNYEPPLGILGATFDRLMGRRLAHAAAADLLERLAGELEQAERAFRDEHPASAGTAGP